jgi:hypothetical protein
MNRFLLSYGLDPVETRRLFTETGATLSGSSALALYLEQEGVEAGFDPNDMDVWLDGTRSGDGEVELDQLMMFLVRSGYALAKDKKEADVYMEHLTRIQRVVTMESQAPAAPKRIIQLIVIRPKDGGDIYSYIANHFDISACMTWWDSDSDQFHTVYPRLTRAKQMFVRRTYVSSINEARAERRLEKYLGRGLTVVEEPPPFWVAPDERKEENMTRWVGQKAFDVWSYEDVDAKEHLMAGEWMILLGCAGAWYAFDRRRLITYMEEHGGVNAGERGVLYDTPYRQTVVYDAWDALAYSDYSVYELVEPEGTTVILGHREESKTLYGMRAYSVAGWEKGEALYTVGKRTELRFAIVEEKEEDAGQEDAGQEDAVDEDAVDEDAGQEDAVDEDAVDEELIRVLEESLLLAEPEALPAPLEEPLEPFVPLEPHPSSLELYRQLMDWIQVDPSMM